MDADYLKWHDGMTREWLATREVICTMLRQLRPDMTEEQHKHHASAVIARLAAHDPPILTTSEWTDPAMKEKG